MLFKIKHSENINLIKGVFHVAFLCDPTVEEWSENEKKEWKEKWIKATKKLLTTNRV